MKKVLTIVLGLLLLMAVAPQMYALDIDQDVGIEYVQADNATVQSVFTLEIIIPVAYCIELQSAPIMELTQGSSIDNLCIWKIDDKITLKLIELGLPASWFKPSLSFTTDTKYAVNIENCFNVSWEVDYPLMFSNVKPCAGTILLM